MTEKCKNPWRHKLIMLRKTRWKTMGTTFQRLLVKHFLGSSSAVTMRTSVTPAKLLELTGCRSTFDKKDQGVWTLLRGNTEATESWTSRAQEDTKESFVGCKKKHVISTMKWWNDARNTGKGCQSRREAQTAIGTTSLWFWVMTTSKQS